MPAYKGFKIQDLRFKNHNLFLIGLFVYLFVGLFMPVVFADVTSNTTTSVFVPPTSSNYQLSISQDVDAAPGIIPQDTLITYTITYGALANAAVTTDNTLTVNFSQNSIDGIDVSDYVQKSATNGYGNAVPIVNLVNKTITWHFTLSPGTTDQIVSFQMKTNEDYTNPTRIVPLEVTANMSNSYATMPQQAARTNYEYRIYPTPTPGITATPTPAPSITPSITPSPSASEALAISKINFSEVTPTSVTLNTTTTQPTQLTGTYGINQAALTQPTNDTTLTTSHIIQLNKLSPDTTYYLKLLFTDKDGNTLSSDLLTFKTSKSSSPVHIDQQSVILVSGNNPLVNTNPLLPYVEVLLPHDKTYTIGMRISAPEKIKNIIAFVENAKVLGANTFSDYNIWSAPMIQEQPGVYIAELVAPSTPNVYDVFARINDTNGNITQTKIAETIVYGPVTVVDQLSGKPIEHARILLSLYDPAKKTYEQIFPSQFQDNPTFTDKNGIAILNNGSGKYKIEVSQYDYRTQTLFFTIDKAHLYPPTVKLQYVGFSVGGASEYYGNTIADFIGQIATNIQNITNTTRYFKLISIIVLLCLSIVTFLLFLVRTRLSLIVIPLFIKHHIQRTGTFQGQLLDAITRTPIPSAVVAISNRATHEVLTTITSNKNGVFYLSSQYLSSDNILNILSPGYRTNKFVINAEVFPAVIYLHHNLVGGPLHSPFIASILNLSGLFFETLLVLSFLLELFFIPTIGIWGSIFVGLSLFNLFLWLLYEKEERL